MIPGKLIKMIMELFLKLLYNQFAWTYDLVANLVSFGQWQKWIKSIDTLIEPIPTLELGFGPGHLQKNLQSQKIPTYGLDLSRQMNRIAANRITKAGLPQNLVRATSSAIPFVENAFSQVIATFPSEYIFQPETIAEIRRVMKPDGKLVVLLMANITGNSTPHKLLNWIYRLTGQTADLNAKNQEILLQPFFDQGFTAQITSIPDKSATLSFLQASLSI
jgi:ubiquinone/menaquinone biosynthesis C-methylase UbiE